MADESVEKPTAVGDGLIDVQHPESLLTTRALQSAIFNSANFSCIATDKGGVVRIFNVGAERMLGYAAAEVINRMSAAVFHDSDELVARADALSVEFSTPIKPGFEALVFKASRGIEDIYELTKVRKDGSRFPAQVSVTALRDPQSAIIGYLLIGTDNTDRRQAEEKRIAQARISERVLRDSELKYRRLFETAKDGILILDIDTGQINDVNPFLTWLLGFSRDEMIGKTVGELSPFKDIESNKIMLERLQEKRYVRYEDLPLETRDGRRCAVEFVSNVYRAGDREVIQCNVRDITERKRLEAQIGSLNAGLEHRVAERTRQLQAANDELDAFGYSVSHDLRAPLRHVMGFVELLQKDASSSLSDKGRRHLGTISDAAKRMATLIDDLLAFSKNARSEMQMTSVNLGSLVDETVQSIQEDIKGREIVWTVGDLPQVRADRALLRLVLVNLITNAVKFTGNRSHATIEIGTVPGDEKETIVFIRDNGVGFDPKYADKLFGVFQRLHSRDEFEGTGIGLANVHRIIHRHGGRTWAEGAVDGGATFYFSIPGRKEE